MLEWYSTHLSSFMPCLQDYLCDPQRKIEGEYNNSIIIRIAIVMISFSYSCRILCLQYSLSPKLHYLSFIVMLLCIADPVPELCTTVMAMMNKNCPFPKEKFSTMVSFVCCKLQNFDVKKVMKIMHIISANVVRGDMILMLYSWGYYYYFSSWDEPKWLMASKDTARRGLVPSNYVEMLP